MAGAEGALGRLRALPLPAAAAVRQADRLRGGGGGGAEEWGRERGRGMGIGNWELHRFAKVVEEVPAGEHVQSGQVLRAGGVVVVAWVGVG